MTAAPPTATPEADTALAWGTALTRSVVYRLLSLSIAFPTIEVLEQRQQLARELDDADDEFREVARPALHLATLPVASLETLRRDHATALSHLTSPDCPDYESAFATTDIFRQSNTMADVAGFYRAQGYQVGGTLRERPDQAGVELEFMAVVALKEAYALERDDTAAATACAEMQTAFLRDHLGRWGISFGRRLEARAPDGSLLEAAGSATATWIEHDTARYRLGPIEQLDSPTLPPPEPPDSGCGVGESAEPTVIGVDEIEMR